MNVRTALIRYLIPGSALAGLLVATVPAMAKTAAAAPTGKITIQSVIVNGSSCRPGTTAVAMAPDNTAFTVTYSAFLAQVGVGAKPSDAKAKCKLHVTVNVPAGYSYAINTADYRGFAALEPGASAIVRTGHRFQGDTAVKDVDHRLVGPIDDYWQATDVTSGLVYSPCGKQRKLEVGAEVTVDAGTSDPKSTTSLVAMDSTDGSIETTYRFTWKACS
jgi:hypothetical protein